MYNNLDFAALENCQNEDASFGEICVKCNRCGRFDLQRIVARQMIEEIKKFARAPLPECKTVYVLRQEDLEMLLKKFAEV